MIGQSGVEGTLIAFGIASEPLLAARIARLTTRPAQIVLVDPTLDPGAPPPDLLAGIAATSVVDAFPGPSEGEAEIMVWSVRGLMSARPPTPALTDLFPGLRCKTRRTVPMCRVTDLADSLRDRQAPISVWIDMPGSEAELLGQLFASSLGQDIRAIRVRSTSEVFFEGGTAAAELIAQMAEHGFNLAGRDDDDPDFPDLSFEIDHRALRIAALDAMLKERRDAALTMSRQLEELEEQLRDGLAMRDARLAELETQLNEAADARDETQRDEARSLARRLAASETEIKARDTRLAKLEAQLKDAAEAREHATSEIEARDARLVELEAQLKDATEAHDAARKHADSEIKARDSELEEERRKSAEKLANAQAATRADTEKLEGQVRELKQRLSLAQNELRRAEGQMELIKDLLLRETSL